MIVVLATLTGRPDKRDEIAAALVEAAAATREEDGCLSYAFARDLDDEDRYLAVERWRDQAALDAHFGTPHMAALLGRADELLAAPPVIEPFPVQA